MIKPDNYKEELTEVTAVFQRLELGFNCTTAKMTESEDGKKISESNEL